MQALRRCIAAHTDPAPWLQRCMFLVLLLCLLPRTWAQESTHNTADNCSPQLLQSWVAQELQPQQRPSTGWETVTLPDAWKQRWPTWNGPIWYRMDWALPCPQQHHALSVSSMRIAGSVYWGDELLWSDRHLTPPYSRSGNQPRWWPLSTAGKSGIQTVWIRVVGPDSVNPGLGRVEIGPVDTIREQTETSIFRQRTAYTLTAAMSAAIGCVAFFVWLWRRSESAYLWFGLMQLMWASYLCLLLQTEPIGQLSSTAQTQLHLMSFVLYAQGFLLFSLRFVGLKLPKIEAFTWLAVLGWAVAFNIDSSHRLFLNFVWVFQWSSLLVHSSCLLVIARAWHTRKTPHLWLALCWFGVLLVASHDIVVAMDVWSYDQTWSSLFSPVSTLFLAGLLGWQLAAHLQRVDHFNSKLQQRVDEARNELAHVLAQQHAQELEHAKLQERVHLAHDLHDGLGGSLVRSLALVEQAAPQLHKDRVLSMLKVLRDDLRQVIDVGSSREVVVPATPALWLAPLRHRFMQILDELQLQAQWQVDAQWQQAPSALQAMAMSRFLEEAFANVLKHSRARQLSITCTQPSSTLWRVVLQDDGVGFDVSAVLSAGMGIGMHSMRTRLGRVGGTLTIHSSAQGSTLIADIVIAATATANPATVQATGHPESASATMTSHAENL